MRSIANFLFGTCLVICVAQFQGPNIDSSQYLETVAGGDKTGGPNPPNDPCEYSGYLQWNCTDLNSACTSGTTDLAQHVGEGPAGDAKATGGTITFGSCSGGAGCSTPTTTELTGDGC